MPETLLKKRKRDEKIKAERKEAAIKAKKERVVKRKLMYKRAEAYVKEYRREEADRVRLHRIAKKNGSYYVPAEPKLVFVIRIRG